jgi:hypothetical protein
MIDLEDFHTGQVGHAPGAPVVTRADDHDLRRASGDRVSDRLVDGRGPKGDHVSHYARHLDSDATLSFSSRALRLGETALSLLAEKNARSRVVEIRDVRQASVGEGAAVRDKVSGPARAISLHDSPSLLS